MQADWLPASLAHDIDQFRRPQRRSVAHPPSGHGRRAILAAEYHTRDPPEATPWAASAGRRHSDLHGADPNDSLSAILSQQPITDPSKQPVQAEPPKKVRLGNQHPAARLLGQSTDALDEWIMRRHSGRYGKKAASSAYRQQVTSAMANPCAGRAPSDSTSATTGQPPPLPPSSRLLAPKVGGRASAGSAPTLWGYGALSA